MNRIDDEASLRLLLAEYQIAKRAARTKQQELNALVRELATREWMSQEEYLQRMLRSVLIDERSVKTLDEQID